MMPLSSASPNLTCNHRSKSNQQERVISCEDFFYFLSLLLTLAEAHNERVQARHTIILGRSAKDEDPDRDKGDDDEGAISTLECS